MTPSKEIETIVNDALKMKPEEAYKWAELLKKIHIYENGHTSIPSLSNLMTLDDGEFENEGPYIFRVRYSLNPHSSDDPSAVVRFKAGNIAEISDAATISGSTAHLDGYDFLGFKGTWEDVIRKVVEINNLVTNPLHHFTL
jgi:hypothetical protein